MKTLGLSTFNTLTLKIRDQTPTLNEKTKSLSFNSNDYSPSDYKSQVKWPRQRYVSKLLLHSNIRFLLFGAILCRRDRFLLRPTFRIFSYIESYFSVADLAFRGCSEVPTPPVHFLQVWTI